MLIEFLRNVYIYLGKPSILSTEECLKILRRVKLSDDKFTSEDYLPGTSGESKLCTNLLRQSGIGS